LTRSRSWSPPRAFATIRLAPAVRLPAANVLTDLREGWSAFRSRSWLWVVVLAFGVTNAVHAAGWYTLGPIIADQAFGRPGWGFVLAAETAGMFVASFLAGVALELFAPRLGPLDAAARAAAPAQPGLRL